jgi:hypothetical protein
MQIESLTSNANAPDRLAQQLTFVAEIDAGGTFGYDVAGHVTKADRENKAADHIFNLLPSDQALRLATAQSHQGPNSRIEQTHRHNHAGLLGGRSSTDRSARGTSPLGQVTEENEQFF